MFEKVDQARFLEGEHDVLRFWRERDIFRQLQRKNAGKPKWSFLDGPITANNPMGVHHAWGRTYKDAYQRYFAMTGRELRYQNGFDCQGLWVEVEVEKQLKLGTKTAIEQFGIDRFNRECKKRVLRFAARQTEQSVRLGYWMEWDDPDELRKLADGIGGGEESEVRSQDSGREYSPPSTLSYRTARGQVVTDGAEQIAAQLGSPDWGGSYFTFSTENNETIWTFLKKCFDRAKIYRGHDVMPWSGRGGSAYSQMEVADGRKLTTHQSCFVRLPLIVERDGHTEPQRHPGLGHKEYLLVWTTTPWTLTSNVAAAVNPELDYVQIKAQIRGDDEPAIYYFAKENLNSKRLEKEFKEGFGRPEWQWPEGVGKLKSISQIFKELGGYEELMTFKGADFIGWRYAGPFDELEAQYLAPGESPGVSSPFPGKACPSGVQSHRVIDGGRDSKGSPNVVAGEGTGIVHIAPGCGDIDHKIGVELGLPVIAPLKEDGTYDEGFGPFTGKEATNPETAQLVFRSLKEKGLLVYVETYPHIYPFCWRTGDELVFRLVDEWFINMDWRGEIQEMVKTIDWLPESIQGRERELEWLTTMRDWMISKKRFWGLALPIWVDPENPSDFEVVGSLAELKERALNGGAGWDEFEASGATPHRPWIDKIQIRSAKSGKLLSRIEDVGNPWLDAGIVPFSTLMYNRDKAAWSDWFPADFVTECFPGQFRNWFYSLLALSTMMRYDETDDPCAKRPFKTLLGHRLVMDENGKPMHKSDGTAIWFEEAAEQLGVDTLRWMYLAQNPASDLRFGTRHASEPVTLQTPDGPISETKEGLPTCKVTSKPADDIRRQVLIPLWNSYAFFVNYAVLDNFDPALPQIHLSERPEIDRWILSRLQELTRTCRESFEGFRVADGMQAATVFIDDLSNWYIRRNRRRFWKGHADAGPPVVANAAPPAADYESTFRVYLTSQKLGLTRERMVIVREVFASRDEFDLPGLLVRLSRFKEGKKIRKSAVAQTLEQLQAAGLLVARPGASPRYRPADSLKAELQQDDPRGALSAWDFDKLAAYQTLYEVLVTLSKLLAPAIPFLTERMHQNLTAGVAHVPASVHLCDYPEVNPAKFDSDLNWKTQQVQTLVRLAHRLRETAEVRVRQPLAELRFSTLDARQAEALEQAAEIIADELNVKSVVRAANLDELVTYAYKPNLKTLGPKYGKLLNSIKTALTTANGATLAPLRTGGSVTLSIDGADVVLGPEDVMVSVQQASDWASADDGGIQVALSTKLSPELIREGVARDLIRQIQQLRKDANLEENQRINVQWSATDDAPVKDLAAAIDAWASTVKSETRADALERTPIDSANAKSVVIGAHAIQLAIAPLSTP